MKVLATTLLVLAGLGCTMTPKHTLRFHEQVPGNLPASRVRFVTLARTGERIAVNPYPTISEREVMSATIQAGPGGNAVLLKFDSHGANLLTEMTTRLRGQYLVVLLDDKPVAAVLIERISATGQFLLFGDMTDAEAVTLADALNQYAGRHRDFGDTRHAP